MVASSFSSLVAVPACHAMACWTPTGFAAVAPLTGDRSVAAVGSITPGLRDPEELRAAMRSIVQDQALVEGHDATSLLHRANARLTAEGIGLVDAVALLTHPADGVMASMVGVGWPAPLVVTHDRLTAAVQGPTRLRAGWTVVLGGRHAALGGGQGMLSPPDVERALALLSRRPRDLAADRTLLAVSIGR